MGGCGSDAILRLCWLILSYALPDFNFDRLTDYTSQTGGDVFSDTYRKGEPVYRDSRRIYPPSREEGVFRRLQSEPSDEQAGDEADTVSNNPLATTRLDIPPAIGSLIYFVS
jgi:hypothetical protein